MLQMLHACIKLLMMLFGSACEHMTSVTTICFLIEELMAAFQALDKTQVAHLPWAIFVDVRSCFNTPHNIMGNPPVSCIIGLVDWGHEGRRPTSHAWDSLDIPVWGKWWSREPTPSGSRLRP